MLILHSIETTGDIIKKFIANWGRITALVSDAFSIGNWVEKYYWFIVLVSKDDLLLSGRVWNRSFFIIIDKNHFLEFMTVSQCTSIIYHKTIFQLTWLGVLAHCLKILALLLLIRINVCLYLLPWNTYFYLWFLFMLNWTPSAELPD